MHATRRLTATAWLATVVAAPASGEDCGALARRLEALDYARARAVGAASGVPLALLYAECDRRGTFAGRQTPEPCDSDPNRVRRLVQFPDRTVVFEAKAAVDADGAPVACGDRRSPVDQCRAWLTYDAGAGPRFVDAERVPYVVVPVDAPGGPSFTRETGIGAGDLAVVMFRGRYAFGVVGDAGPWYRLGEASIRVHVELGNPQCVDRGPPCRALVNDGYGDGLASGVTYVVFPGSRPASLTAASVVDVGRRASRAALLTFLARYADAPAGR